MHASYQLATRCTLGMAASPCGRLCSSEMRCAKRTGSSWCRNLAAWMSVSSRMLPPCFTVAPNSISCFRLMPVWGVLAICMMCSGTLPLLMLLAHADVAGSQQLATAARRKAASLALRAATAAAMAAGSEAPLNVPLRCTKAMVCAGYVKHAYCLWLGDFFVAFEHLRTVA